MNAIEIIQALKEKYPKKFSKLPEKGAAQIVNAALMLIANEVGEIKTGSLKISGLGCFRVREGEKEVNCQLVAVRRVSFRVAKPKGK